MGAHRITLFPIGSIPRSLPWRDRLGRPAGIIPTARSPWLQRTGGWSAGDPARGFEMPRGWPRGCLLGFSLLEVIIAVGIFGTTVTVMLGLLPALTRQARATADTLAALHLPDGVRLELQRVATVGGFEALAGQITPMLAPLPATLALAADREATRVQTLDYLPPIAADLLPVGSRYFQIEVWRFNQAPLAYDPGGGALALHVRVSWPYYTPDCATATPLIDREQVTFNVALER